MIFGIIAALLGVFGAIAGSLINASSVEQTNQTNKESVESTNAANVQQAELQYQRTRPLQQVRDLMSVGLSKQGALSHLTGGGSYSAPVLSSANAQSPQLDVGALSSAFERIGNVPSNVAQLEHVKTQTNLIDAELAMKQEEHKQRMEFERERMQRERDEELRKKYGQNVVEMTDKLRARVSDALAKYGVNVDDIKNETDLVSKLKLHDDELWRNAPATARDNVLQYIRDNAAQNRADRQQNNADIAAKDAHTMSTIQQAIERINLQYLPREKREQLLNIMRTGQNLIEDGKIKFQDARSKEFENFVREAGIDNEADAHALGQELKKLSVSDELDLQYRRELANKGTGYTWNQARVLLRDLGELFLHIKL